jgi:hypothetical protein
LTHHSVGDILSAKEERNLSWPSHAPNATLKTLPIPNFAGIVLLDFLLHMIDESGNAKIMGSGIARCASVCVSRFFIKEWAARNRFRAAPKP